MSSLFVNKVLGAGLAAGLGIIMINKFSNVVMRPDVPAPEKFAYSLAVEAVTQQAEAIPVAFPSPAWLDARNAEKGAKVFKKCRSCHTVVVGGKDGTGPALWNIVGRPMASTAGFSYSGTMTAMGSAGSVWGYAELDKFLAKPKNYVPKTTMAFNGLKKETDRAALIEYLRLAADAPTAQLTAVVEEAVIEVPGAAQETAGEMPEMTPEEIIQETMPEEMAGEAVDELVEEVAPVEGGQ